MFGKVKSLVKNHWRKAVYAAVGVKAISYGLTYAANRILLYQEEQTKELWMKMKKKELFDRTDANAQSTFLSLLPNLRGTIERILDSETLTKTLKSNSGNKLEAWEELKTIAFSRVLASVYGSALLNLLVRIQLHVIGGYVIQDSLATELPSSSSNEDSQSSRRRQMSAEVQVEYLGLTDYFIRDGMERLSIYILKKAEQVIRPVPLKRRVSVQDVEQLVWHIVERIREDSECGNSNSPLVQFIFPPEILRRYNNFSSSSDPTCLPEEPVDLLEQLMSETYDLLSCSDATSVISSLETHGISHFVDRLLDIVPDLSMTQSMSVSQNTSTSSSANGEGGDSSMDTSSSFLNPMEDTVVPFARIIPPMNSYAPNNLSDADPWISTVVRADTVRLFAANVYESFSCPVPVPF